MSLLPRGCIGTHSGRSIFLKYGSGFGGCEIERYYFYDMAAYDEKLNTSLTTLFSLCASGGAKSLAHLPENREVQSKGAPTG